MPQILTNLVKNENFQFYVKSFAYMESVELSKNLYDLRTD